MSGVYKSDCGHYLCQVVSNWGDFEAWRIDGSIHWRHDDRIRTWADEKVLRHPLEYSVIGYSGHKTGQEKGSFTLTLAHCDTSKFIVPWTGNTIIDTLHIVFRRRVPPQNIPSFMKPHSEKSSQDGRSKKGKAKWQ